jgi:flagellar hook-length control protein FliK
VAAAGARPNADTVARETVRASQSRTLAGAQAAQSASSSAPAAGRVVDQVASGLSLAVREGRTEAVLTLRPDALGEVRVQIVSGPEGLTIRLSAEREAVGELLRAGVADLQEALAGQQVAVSEVVVMQNAPAAPQATAETPLWQERQWSRQEPEAENGDQPERHQPDDEQDEE